MKLLYVRPVYRRPGRVRLASATLSATSKPAFTLLREGKPRAGSASLAATSKLLPTVARSGTRSSVRLALWATMRLLETLSTSGTFTRARAALPDTLKVVTLSRLGTSMAGRVGLSPTLKVFSAVVAGQLSVSARPLRRTSSRYVTESTGTRMLGSAVLLMTLSVLASARDDTLSEASWTLFSMCSVLDTSAPVSNITADASARLFRTLMVPPTVRFGRLIRTSAGLSVTEKPPVSRSEGMSSSHPAVAGSRSTPFSSR
mmetsp:Transcript_1628/g.5630  ORF Transcript_1628/g.5630 Transcript_1628/m.5630 type:complete len:259 (+) Transcript_1628:418-1194(+)